uniref:Peptidase_M13 domain-containing protein n=1 Tax=Parastrongyloides trichosuri TaxID=131310 RepID=A0A0N4Z1F8_PARTI
MFVQNPLIIEDVIGVEKITKLYKIANRMFQIMKKNFAEIIEEKKWLDKESKENMIKKLNGIKFYDRLYDPYHNLSNVEQFFKLLVYKTDHTYENITYYTEIFSILMDAKMGTHNMPIYIEDILQPNAYYYRIDNTVHILLGYLLKPTFDPKYMTSMIFGGLGGTIGHEMLHAFDGIGMNFFLEATRGQLLSDYSQEIYLKKKQCLIDQYEKPDSKLPSLTIDGSRSYGENLSDNSGIKLAYKAYKKYEKMYGAEKNRMKKFRKYTNDQLFFISFAHSYCSVMSDYIRARKISSPRSVHLPDDIRVILSTANREEFSKAFECKVGTKMNPDDKCEIWKFKHKTL